MTSGAATTESADRTGPLAPPYRLVTVGIIALVSLVAFEALAVSTAMPVVARALGGLRSYGLAFSLFLTMQLLGTVLAGGWSDARGPRGPILSGLALFATGLVVSGTATGFPVLLVGRIVAGVGGGFVTVALYVVVARSYPKPLHPRVFGWISAAWVLPSVVGPPLAGWLAGQVSWRAVFLVVPPLAVVALLALLPRLAHLEGDTSAEQPGTGTGARRWLLGLGLAAGATLLQWGAQEVRALRPPVLLALAAGALLVALSLPGLLPPGALRLHRGLPTVVTVRGLFTGCFFAAETFVPLMLVTERDLRPALAGFALTGGAVGWAGGSWLQGRPGLRLSRPTLLVLGAGVLTLTVALLPLGVLGSVPPWLVAVLWTVAGFGMGLGMASTSVLLLDLSAPSEQGRNSASLQVSDALGGVLGIGAAGAVFAALHDPRGSDGDVFSLIWWGLAVVGLAAVWAGRRTRLPS